MWRFDQSRKPLNLDSLKPHDHMFCESKIPCPYAREYISKLEGDWCRLFVFITRTQLHKDVYYGIKGTEHVNLKKFEDGGRLLSKGESYATLKTESGSIQVLCSCQIPCLSIRLIITANEDDIPVEADNEYADAAVGFLTAQIDVCWKILPQLFNRMDLIRIFIRKFETHTVSLCIGGVEDVGIDFGHKMPMKEQIRNLKHCNFDPSLHDMQLAKFPRLDYAKCKVLDEYCDDDCICFQSYDNFVYGGAGNENDNDGNENDNDGNENDNDGNENDNDGNENDNDENKDNDNN